MTHGNDFLSSHLDTKNIKGELELDYINLTFIHYLQEHNFIPIFQFGFTDLSSDTLSETGAFFSLSEWFVGSTVDYNQVDNEIWIL